MALRQLEYYFGDRNWPKDTYLQGLADDEGLVSLREVMSFPRLKALLPSSDDDEAFVAACEAVKASSFLRLDGDRVGRGEPPAKRQKVLEALVVDDRETKRRGERRSRFSSTSSKKEEGTPTLLLLLEEDDDDEEEEGGGVGGVGTSCRLEKSYFRLTSTPDLSEVRPPAVLEEAFRRVLAKYAVDGDYAYARDQLKAIRQDLSVQQNVVSVDLACDVYEGSARLALEEVDFDDYAQCQSRLAELHAHQLDRPARREFIAYRLLRALGTGNRATTSLAVTTAFAEVARAYADGEEDRFLAFAMKVTEALNLDDYATLFKLYRTAPGSAARTFLDALLPKVRRKAYASLLLAFHPTPAVPLARIARGLGFHDRPEDCRAWLGATMHARFHDDHLLLLPSRDALNARTTTTTTFGGKRCPP